MPVRSPDNPGNFQQTLQAIRQNDDAALAALYKAHYAATQQYVLQNRGTAEQAKDIFQEAFIVLWRNIQMQKFVPENEQSIAAYLYRVSKNKWISYLRSAQHKLSATLPQEQAEDSTADEIDAEQQSYINNVVRHLQQLGHQCKELLTAFYYKKQSMRQIGEQFGWTEASAKNNKYRCLEKLRNLMKNQND